MAKRSTATSKSSARTTSATARAPRSGSRPAQSKRSAATRAPAKKKATQPKETCFVISPFGGWHDDYHREIFCGAIEAAGLKPVRADDLFRSSNIVHDIWQHVSRARVLLADLTGKNPNVFYELGLAHAAHKPVLLVTQEIEDVPFDLRALRVIQYDVEHPSWGHLLRDNITRGLQETLASPERSVLPTFLIEEPQRKSPTVSAEEKRLLGMQQEIASLRSEIRERPSRQSNRLSPGRAWELVQKYYRQGTPPDLIVELVSDRGAPENWVRDRIAELQRGEN